MLEDCFAAVDALRANVELSRYAFLGTRLGGLVAGAAATAFDDAPLVLWQPVLDPAEYFREAFRAAAIRELRREASGKAAPSVASRPTVETLEGKGWVDVLGYSVHRSLYRSFLDHRLPDELGEAKRDVLLLQIDRGADLSEHYARAAESLRSRRFAVDSRAIRADDHWWLSGNPRDSAAALRAVVGATTGWLTERLR
jgi:hypothetical protein